MQLGVHCRAALVQVTMQDVLDVLWAMLRERRGDQSRVRA
jgi:hypothetical protein